MNAPHTARRSLIAGLQQLAPLQKLGTLGLRKPRLMHTIGVLSVAVSVIYLTARIAVTEPGTHPIAFWTLLGAEAFSTLTLALFFYDAWIVPPTVTPTPFDTTVDIVIATYDEDVSILEPTIVSSLRVRSVRKVWVLDDGNRQTMKELCEKLGAIHVTRPTHEHAKAGNINHALPLIDAELILFLDADHVPSRDIIEHMSGYFANPLMAVVQSPHSFRNRDSPQHTKAHRHEQSLFYEVLMPARAKSQTSFWSGSAAILRRSALVEVGGVATETVTEDLHTTLKLQRAGYLVAYHNEVLVSALAPHTTAEYLLQRDRWARGTLAVLTSPESPIFGRGWRITQRLHYLNNFLYYFIPLQRLAFAAVLVMILVLGWLPVANVTPFMIVLILLNLAMMSLSSVLFARGKRDAFDGTQFTWLSAAIHLKALIDVARKKSTSFIVTPKVASQLSFTEKLSVLRLPLTITVVLVLSWAYSLLRLLGITQGVTFFDTWMPGLVNPVIFGWATFFLILELASLERLLRWEFQRKQVRNLWRFNTRLAAQVNGHSVIITDIHESGAAFESEQPVTALGEETELNIPRQSHAPHAKHAQLRSNAIRGFLTPVRIVELPNRVVTAGTIRWASDQDRWEAQDLCYAQLALAEERPTSIQ